MQPPGNPWRRFAGRYAARFAAAAFVTVVLTLAAGLLDPSAPLGLIRPLLAGGVLAVAGAIALSLWRRSRVARVGSLLLAALGLGLGLAGWVTSDWTGSLAPRVYLVALAAFGAALCFQRVPSGRTAFRFFLALGGALAWAPSAAPAD